MVAELICSYPGVLNNLKPSKPAISSQMLERSRSMPDRNGLPTRQPAPLMCKPEWGPASPVGSETEETAAAGSAASAAEQPSRQLAVEEDHHKPNPPAIQSAHTAATFVELPAGDESVEVAAAASAGVGCWPLAHAGKHVVAAAGAACPGGPAFPHGCYRCVPLGPLTPLRFNREHAGREDGMQSLLP